MQDHINSPWPEWQPRRANDLFAQFQTPVENHYGDELEKVWVVTKMLGRTWGARVLALVTEKSVFRCPICRQPITHVVIGKEPRFNCDVTVEFGGARFVANLLSEHTHDEEEAGEVV
jgi:hypothetical protein